MKAEMARFDTRLPKSQKEYFEMAATIGGFKTLSEFIIHSTMELSNKIVEKRNEILLSQEDAKIFFDAIVNPPKANQALKDAIKLYNERINVQ